MIGSPKETRISGRGSVQKAYSMASGMKVAFGSRAASAPRPSCRRSGRSRTSMKRPCGVSHTALCDEARIACVVRRKVQRAARRVLLDAEEAEMLEEAVALEHRGVDRCEGGAVREELAREQQADERIPPRRVVEIDRPAGARRSGGGSPLFRMRKRMEVPAHVARGCRRRRPS